MLIIYIISTKGFIYVMILDNFFVYRAIDFQERFMSTILTGKDAPLEQTLEHFTDVARRLNLDIIEDNWLNPTDNLWSVNIKEASCPQIFANGKGACREAALASAYGELFERLATHCSFSDYYLGDENANAEFVHYSDEKWTEITDENQDTLPNEILNASLRKFYTQHSSLTLKNLVDLQSSSYKRGVCSIPFTNARNGEVVYFPVNLLDNLYASNGMSAGNSDYEALVQGLSEIIERYVKNEIIKRGLALPLIPDGLLERYPKSFNTLKALNGGNLKVCAYDASLGGKFPVVCVVLFNQRNASCYAAFGSHPIFEVALERTLTELMQGRSFSDLDNFEEPTFDLEQTSDCENLISHFVDSTGVLPIEMFKNIPNFSFVSWDFTGSTHDQYKALRYMVDKLGFDVYVRSYKFLDIPVYRIIVPGMSEIYPIDDLIYNNNNQAILYQEALMTLPETQEDKETYVNYLDELENAQFADEASLCQILGLLPDAGSAWESMTVGELKCSIAICAGEFERALEYARFVATFGKHNLSLERLRLYQCLIKKLELKLMSNLKENDYSKALETIYSKKTSDCVQSHLDGNEQFFNLNATDLNLKGFLSHQALIRIYLKLKEQDAKKSGKKNA